MVSELRLYHLRHLGRQNVVPHKPPQMMLGNEISCRVSAGCVEPTASDFQPLGIRHLRNIGRIEVPVAAVMEADARHERQSIDRRGIEIGISPQGCQSSGQAGMFQLRNDDGSQFGSDHFDVVEGVV